MDFILWLIKENNEEEQFDLWKHSQSELGYAEWKKKNMKASAEEIRVSKRKQIDSEKEKESIKYASKLLGKALGKGGGD